MRCLHTLVPIVVAGAVVTGCGSGSDSPQFQAGDETGRLSLGVSDAPVHDAQKVCITFDAIEFKAAGAAPFTVALDPAEKINLLEFQGMNAAPLLVDQEVPAGNYEWLRLAVDAETGSNGGAGDTGSDLCDGEASYIAMNDGGVYNLYVPSGAQTGLKLVRGFTVPVNGSADFTVEFDLGRSIVAPPGQSPDLKLKPTLRLVDNALAGALTGAVDPLLAGAADCEPSVYLFADGVAPNPIDDSDPADPDDPVATAMVNATDPGDGSIAYGYTIGFLAPGDYEAAFTCDGTTFEPAGGAGVTITAGETATLDF